MNALARSRLAGIALVLLASAAPKPGRADVLSPSPGAVTAQTLHLPDKPGSIKGLADPATISTFSGQVSYSIPIVLPAGRAGFGPSLTLAYSGDLGNGPVGVGWNLGAIGIRRALREGVPTYSDTDQLELVGVGGGGRLYTKDGKRYWVEGAGHSIKIDRFGDWFDVTDGNGVRYVLGLNSNSVQGDGQRFSWLVESIFDVTGLQRIDFTYEHDRGEVYLKSIVWGPPQTTGGAPAFSLQVNLENRPDPVVSWATGFEVRTEKRVSSLQVTSFGETVRRYTLEYAPTGPDFRLSRLKRVTQTGREIAGQTPLGAPPVTVTYEPPSGDGVFQVPALAGWALNERETSLVDVDGDGMADLYRMEQGAHVYRKGTGTGFSDARYSIHGGESADLSGSRLMDLDGDSRPDLVTIVNDTWRWSRLVPDRLGSLTQRWIPQGEWSGTTGLPLHGNQVVFADINGDRRVDVIQPAAGAILVRLATDRGLGPVVRRPQLDPTAAQVEPGAPNVRFEDFNGDHLVDVAYLTDEWMKVWLGRGDGTFVPSNIVNYPWGRGAFADSDVALADLDRDGLVDLIRITAGNVFWFPGLPGGGFAKEIRGTTRPVATPVDAVVAIADVNGNGSQDIVWSTSTDMWVLDLAGHSSAGMVREFDNGMGMTSTVTYSTSALLSVADEAAGNAWTSKLPLASPVPIAIENRFASGDPARTTRFAPRDGAWDGAERLFVGYLGSERIVPGPTPAEDLREETRYLPGFGGDRVLRGQVWLKRLRDGTGLLNSETVIDWEAMRVTSSPALPDSAWARKPAQKGETTRSFEGVTDPIETRSTFEFDGEVRVIAEHHLGRTDISGDEKEVRRTFGDDDLLWVRSRTCEESLLEAGSMALVGKTQTFYTDDGTNILPLCKVGRGWSRVVKGFRAGGFESNETDAWIELTRNSYDSFGNSTVVFDDGVERTINFDTRSLRAVSETVQPGNGMPALTWNVSLWDEVLGAPLRFVDPNQVATDVVYDGLGRQVSEQKGTGQCPHEYVQYDWTKPDQATFFRPTVTTYAFNGKHSDLTPNAGEVACSAHDPRGQAILPGTRWIQKVDALTGGGEAAYSAARLGASSWIISGWKERDPRGNVVVAADPFYFNQAALPTTRPAVSGFQFKTTHYDSLGRLDRETQPNGAERSTSYKAYEVTVGHNTIGGSLETKLADSITRTDAFGRKIRRERKLMNGILEEADAKYDAADHMVEVRLQGGQATHTFKYDTLGLLRVANDPDIGERRWRYDGVLLIRHKNAADQVIGYFYDGAGRLIAKGPRTLADYQNPVIAYDGGQGNDYVLHYDDPEPGQSSAVFSNLKSRLSWVSEPPGAAPGLSKKSLGYDVFGRETLMVRRVANVPGEARRTFSPAGLLFKEEFDDGFTLDPQYDSAGRLSQLGDIWHAGVGSSADTTAGMDAASRVLGESYGSGVTQTFDRDVVGLPTRVMVKKSSTALYGVSVDLRTSYGVPLHVTDLVSQGLDQSASYVYDDGGRLIDAALGNSDATRWRFRYKYDGLQNMTARFQKAPANTPAAQINVISGYYSYGGPGYGPRQLRRINHVDCPNDLTTFHYDRAGRVDQQDDQKLTYDVFDQLVKVEKPANTVLVSHGYGFAGDRTSTVGGGVTQLWFDPGYTFRNGPAGAERWHYVNVGDRVVARLVFDNTVTSFATGSMAAATSALLNRAFAAIEPKVPGMLAFATLAGGLALIVLTVIKRRRPGRPIVAIAAASALLLAPLGCSQQQAIQSGLEQAGKRLYFHQGLAAGPSLITKNDGRIEEERRFDPFGEPLDGDLKSKDPRNSLNKERNPETGWSYHGARWMSPQTARWLTPDPLAKTPHQGMMEEPADLNPYVYGRQNPELYWDPQGGFVFLLAAVALAAGGEGASLAALLGCAALVGGTAGYVVATHPVNVETPTLVAPSSCYMGDDGLGLACFLAERMQARAAQSLQVEAAAPSQAQTQTVVKSRPDVLSGPHPQCQEQPEPTSGSKRKAYLGNTPGRASRTGRDVQKAMREAKKLRENEVTGETEFFASDQRWYPLKEADMTHTLDAVKWWNNTGRYLGARHTDVREWMLDPNNYTLDHRSLNRSEGAKLDDRYLPPCK
jgi:RHS repeat-associated protein